MTSMTANFLRLMVRSFAAALIAAGIQAAAVEAQGTPSAFECAPRAAGATNSPVSAPISDLSLPGFGARGFATRSDSCRTEYVAAHIEPEPEILAGRVVLGSTIGWGFGLLAGVGTGLLIQPSAGDSYVGAGAWWLGGLVGTSIGTALGAHLANDRRGNFGAGFAGSLLIAPVALLAAALTADVGGLLLVPAAQIGMSVVIERRTGRERRP